MSQNHLSNSFSMSHMLSHDDFDRPHSQIVNLNYYTLQVRRPDDQNVLQFLEQQIECKKINNFYLLGEMATFSKNDPHIQVEPLKQKQPPSSSSDEIQQQQLQLSLNKQSPEQQQGLIASPSIEHVLFEQESKRKFKQSFNSMSPTRKIRKSNIGKMSALLNSYSNKMKIVSNFVKLIKSISPFKAARFLSNQQELLINDKSSQTVCQKKESFIDSFSEKQLNKAGSLIIYLLQSTISPLSSFLLVWESFKLILTFYLLFQFSIQICFDQPVTIYLSNIHISFQISVTIFLVLDVILNFKAGFYWEGLPVTNYIKIAQHYFKDKLIIDLISLLPIVLNLFSNESIFIRILNCLLILKVSQLRDIAQGLEDRIQLSPAFLIGYRFFRVLGLVFVFAHIFGCLWHVVGTMNSDRSWIRFMQLEQDQWYILYSYSIYWSVMTMSTVGYGDITAQNEVEVLFSVFTMLFASIIFAYSVNTIGLILDQMTRNNRQTDENLAVINRYMKRKNLQPQLQYRIRQYLQNLWIEQSELRVEDEQKIIRQLSNQLQEEIQVSLYGKFLQNVPLFQKYFSKNLISELIKQIEEYRVQKKSYITETGSMDGAGLYCMLQGEAEIYLEIQEKKFFIGKMKKGDVFGQSTFFYLKPQPYTVKTKSICSIAFLSNLNFIETIKRFPKDYEMYKMIQDKIIYGKTKINIGTNCFGCKSNLHDIDECPNLHFVLNNDIVIRKNLYSKNQDREKKQRGDRRSTNARFGQKLFDDAASLFQENNNISIYSHRERTELVNDVLENMKAANQKAATSIRSPSHTSSKQSNLRIRKKSRSLNSGTVPRSVQTIIFLCSKERDYAQMISQSHNSHDNESLHRQQSNYEQLSAIPQIRAPTNQQSILSQSSIQMLLKENSRKPSQQQNSDNSNTPPFINPHKSSSQSKSKENSGTNSSNNINFLTPSALAQEENKSFQQNQHQDSMSIANQRQRKSLIGVQPKPVVKNSPIQNLQPIPSVSEQNDSKKYKDEFASFQSMKSKSNTQKSDESQFQFMKKSIGSLQKQQSSYKSHIAFQDLQQLDQSNYDTNKKQQSSKFTGETARQFVNAPQLPSYEDFKRQYLQFEVPQSLHSYYPAYNLENILEKYNKYQVKRLTELKNIMQQKKQSID